MTKAQALSLREARAIAVTAAERTTRGSVRTALDLLGIVQLDTISTLARAHQLTLGARAAVTVDEVDRQLWDGARPLAFETWAHAASLVPITDWPAWGFRMRRGDRVWGRDAPDAAFQQRLLDRVAAEGPLPMQKLKPADEPGGGWEWGPTRMAVEHLLRSGRLICARRQGFRRIVDLPDRVVPQDLLNTELTDEACLDRLVTGAIRVLGVATAADVADYLRVRQQDARDTLDRLDVPRVQVEGWKEQAWLAPDRSVDAVPRAPGRARFVGPFDNLVWYRSRVKRLFDFEHTLEAYLPPAKRAHGYYVCPLLAGTALVGRADLASSGGVLRILRLSFEKDGDRSTRALAAAVKSLAALVGASTVAVPDGVPWVSALHEAAVAGDLGEGVRLSA